MLGFTSDAAFDHVTEYAALAIAGSARAGSARRVAATATNFRNRKGLRDRGLIGIDNSQIRVEF
jgi:hypothetical protein